MAEGNNEVSGTLNGGEVTDEAYEPSTGAAQQQHRDGDDTDEVTRSTVQRLKDLYFENLRPLESLCHFEHFYDAALTKTELESRPQVLLVGQYSTGKTSLVKWVTGIQSSFFDIRPQPSTDRFMAIVHGDDERIINGNAATCLADLPYAGLSQFGSAFLSKFQVLVESAKILRSITFIDTPGVLSGDKQRISRGYDFEKVCKWFAGRCDLILLLFDAHKLDISDEFREVIEAIREDSGKCRCVLNKADEIDGENLVKVYGALMWNLGKILLTPEVARMYVGSFWDKEYRCRDLERLLDSDRRDLIKELHDLPRSVCVRRINAVVARARAVKVCLALCANIRSKLPAFGLFGRRHRYERWLCDRLPDIYREVVRERRLSPGDLPPLDVFRERLTRFKDFRRLPRWKQEQAEQLDTLINVDVPQLMAKVGGVSSPSFQLPTRGLDGDLNNKWADSLGSTKGTPAPSYMWIAVFALAIAVAYFALLMAQPLVPAPAVRENPSGFESWFAYFRPAPPPPPPPPLAMPLAPLAALQRALQALPLQAQGLQAALVSVWRAGGAKEL